MTKYYTLYGSPGTGKTTELIRRMKIMVASGVKPGDICFVGFTKASAAELQGRIGDLGIKISTLHSLAYRSSGIIKDQVIGWDKLKEYAALSKIPITGANPDEADELSEGDEYLAIIGLARAKMEPLESAYMQSNRPGSWARLEYFAAGYDRWKKANGFVDFNDMLCLAALAEPPDCKVMFIDEAQDLSNLQWDLINHWKECMDEVYIAGDDDQAIYVWGGANPHGMDDFSRANNSDCLVLPQSYRIPASVHKVAHGILDRISRRVDKVYLPRDEEGVVRWVSDFHMTGIKHGDDTMVLFRNHCLRKEIEDDIIEKALPYVVEGGKPGHLHGWPGSAVRAWLRVKEEVENIGNSLISQLDIRKISSMLSPADSKRFIENPVMFVASNNWRTKLIIKQDVRNYLMRVEDKYGLSVKPTIRMSTIHASKGREADKVVLVNGMGDRTAESMLVDPDSEYRTFYVGATRARHELYIVESTNPIRIPR